MTENSFADRHIGLTQSDIETMLTTLGYQSLDELTDAVVPVGIADNEPLKLAAACSEEQALAELQQLAKQNKVVRSLIGQGYYDTHTPKVIQRNVLENPAWYTAYTPYQPEISQGRLEVLFYFQTMVTELTGMDIANASLLDEGTAAGEALTLAHRALKGKRNTCLVSKHCHPQTLTVLQTRAAPLGIELIEFDETGPDNLSNVAWEDIFGVIVQYPNTRGSVINLTELTEVAHEHAALVMVASDLLALSLLKSPGELGADIVVGNSQRFGVPMGFGGPHAGFFAVKDKYKRSMPGRLVGQSIDAQGQAAYRLALQTREQHIRREKATSNICTAQALLAIMATLYACYQGPEQLRATAVRVNRLANTFAAGCRELGLKASGHSFDTVSLIEVDAAKLVDAALHAGFNVCQRSATEISVAFDETCSLDDVNAVLRCFGAKSDVDSLESEINAGFQRTDQILTQAVFHDYRSETEMMRYLRRLSDKDIALDRSMIALGSCL